MSVRDVPLSKYGYEHEVHAAYFFLAEECYDGMRSHGLGTHRVSSVGELVEAVDAIESARRQVLWYRGHADSRWDVEPSIARGYSTADLRMFVQQGCFTVHSDRTPLNKMSGNSKFLWRIVIEVPHVLTMAHQIRLCGLRQGDLFPDLGNLAQELRRTYPPGWAAP